MGIATIDKESRRSGHVLTSDDGLGGGGGDRGGGGRSPKGMPPFESMERSFEKVRLVTWFILLVVLMTFAGLIAAYVVVSTNGVIEWNPFKLPVQVWISTAMLIASSATYAVSHRLRVSGRHGAAKNWLLGTTVLGAMFIASQLVTWIALYRAGYYLQSNPYAGFFYFITVLHAIHVLGGICALGLAVTRTWTPPESAEEASRRISVSKSVGEYWHFMDALWIVLVLMLGFWK
jgi:cytochrome c oxidase subunit 3